MDARRFARRRGLLILGPRKIYDTKPALIGGLFARDHGRLLDYSRKAYEFFFRHEFEADQPEAVADLLASVGLSAQAYREYLAGAGEVAYEAAQAEAAADAIFGVPIFLFKQEPFWGYDRIPILEERLREAKLEID
jgi:2-hydroxychromene-2-carboxylate isomerase